MGATHTYRLLGLMSGSSLDGLDLAACSFTLAEGQAEPLDWQLLASATRPLSKDWMARLKALPEASALELALAHAQFGQYLGQEVEAFLSEQRLAVDAIASHGHTIFHYPAQGMSLQLGDGAAIAGVTGLDTMDNFRMQDVSLGGQGAPIAPIADQLLFSDYAFMLNLGGIANISAQAEGGYVAFDCTGANQVLNALAAERGLPYDRGGAIARSGQLLPELLERALALPYHAAPYPKSLGNDWVREQLIPLYVQAEGRLEDRMNTACRQIALILAQDIAKLREQERLPAPPHRMMATGGGALNDFLMACIREACPIEIEIPSPGLIEYKEAIMMALMGALRLHHQPNVLPSVSGAKAAACGGALHLGWKERSTPYG